MIIHGTAEHLAQLITERETARRLLARVCQSADRLLDCLNEFAPDYPQACSEYYQALDTDLAAAEAAGCFRRRASP
jgi:hypothetical protein